MLRRRKAKKAAKKTIEILPTDSRIDAPISSVVGIYGELYYSSASKCFIGHVNDKTYIWPYSRIVVRMMTLNDFSAQKAVELFLGGDCVICLKQPKLLSLSHVMKDLTTKPTNPAVCTSCQKILLEQMDPEGFSHGGIATELCVHLILSTLKRLDRFVMFDFPDWDKENFRTFLASDLPGIKQWGDSVALKNPQWRQYLNWTMLQGLSGEPVEFKEIERLGVKRHDIKADKAFVFKFSQHMINTTGAKEFKVKGEDWSYMWHGTPFNNAGSIIRNGLVSLSHSKMMDSAAAYGPGIYASNSIKVSLGYTDKQAAHMAIAGWNKVTHFTQINSVIYYCQAKTSVTKSKNIQTFQNGDILPTYMIMYPTSYFKK